ncbi:MAG: hypothetical protein WC443_12620 [Desulfobaccales bacterium]
MRNKRLLQFLVLACLVLGAVPVLAGTVSLNATHDFSVGITGNLNFDVVTLTAAASGYASYPEQNPDPVENTSSGAERLTPIWPAQSASNRPMRTPPMPAATVF